MDRPKLKPVSTLKPKGIELNSSKPKLELKPIKKVEMKSKKELRREKAARVRAARLKNQDDKPSTYTTASLDPNASVNHNAISQSMFNRKGYIK